MRKLTLILLSFVAISSYAASVTWSTAGNIVDRNGATLTSGLAYLVSVPTATPPMYAGEKTWNMNGGMVINVGTYANGVWSNTYTPESLPGNTNSYYLVFSTQTSEVSSFSDFEASTWVAVSEAGSYLEYTLTPGAANDTALISFQADNLAWKEIVPEPTVMALLALGVAGLALRRKQV